MALPIVLGPILAAAGTKFLGRIVGEASPAARIVVEKIGAVLGGAATPEAIADRFKADPDAVIAAAREVEAGDPAMWEYLAFTEQGKFAVLQREDERKSPFSWAWRPAMSWLLIVMWAWSGMLLPIVNTAFGSAIGGMSIGDLVTFSGIWLGIYSGGHMAQNLAGRWAETKIAEAQK